MSTQTPPQQSTFWRICDDLGECHCDFRYTIYGCEETYIAKIIYTMTAILSAVLALVAASILYFHLNYRNQKIFDIQRGFPRPKPIESMALFGTIFNLMQTIHAIFVLTNSIPNPVFRSYMLDLGFQIGYCGFASYLFGVAYTLSESSRVMYDNWVKSHTIVNVLCVATITLPFITNAACAVAAGVYAVNGNNELASKLTMVQYYLWAFYCGYLGMLLLFAGVRLIRLLEKHLVTQSDLRINVNKVKTGALKVRIIVVVGTSCMWSFAFLALIYGVCRDALISDQASNTVIAAVALLMGPIATFFVEIAVLINPGIAAQLSNISLGSSSDSYLNRFGNTTTSSKKPISIELAMSLKSRSTRFLSSSSQLDDDVRFSLDPIKKPHESIDALILQEEKYDTQDSNTIPKDGRQTQVEEEQFKYNATINRVRTPPPSHNYSNSNSA